MSTCDSCKWWGEGAPLFWDKRRCDHPKLRNEGGGLFVYGESDDLNPLDDPATSLPANKPSTGPKFGCVHHDPK